MADSTLAALAAATALTGAELVYGVQAGGDVKITAAQIQTFVLGNSFLQFSGPTTTAKTFALPDASATILTTNAAVTVPQGGTGAATLLAHGILLGNGTSAIAALAVGATGTLLAGATGADPAFSATPTLGANGGTGGAITFKGSTSGSVALQVAAAAGTGTVFQLPATNGTSGYVLQTNGSGVTSWVAASGGSPGGADTNVQFNSSSAFGGDNGFTYAGSGQATLALGTIAANAKALNITGTFNNAAVTFDAPFFMNIVDTASNANSLLLDVQVSSSSKLKLRKDGVLHKVPDGSYPAPDIKMGSLGAGLSASYGGAFTWSRDGSTGTISGHAQSGWGLILNSGSDNSKFGWSSDPGPTTGDLFLSRDAAAILAQRNSTNAQASRLYETYTDASNNSMLRFDACKTTAVVHRIMSEANGTGTLRNIAIDGFSKSGAPTSTQLPAGTFGVFKDSGGGGVVIAYNDGGTIKTAALT